MLSTIKDSIAEEQMDAITLEANIVGEDDDDIRDLFLDGEDPEMDAEGNFLDSAEDDPEVEELVDKLPEFDGDITDEELEQLEESFIPETLLESHFEGLDEDDDYYRKNPRMKDAEIRLSEKAIPEFEEGIRGRDVRRKRLEEELKTAEGDKAAKIRDEIANVNRMDENGKKQLELHKKAVAHLKSL